jgi:hypothetical protein
MASLSIGKTQAASKLTSHGSIADANAGSGLIAPGCKPTSATHLTDTGRRLTNGKGTRVRASSNILQTIQKSIVGHDLDVAVETRIAEY